MAIRKRKSAQDRIFLPWNLQPDWSGASVPPAIGLMHGTMTDSWKSNRFIAPTPMRVQLQTRGQIVAMSTRSCWGRISGNLRTIPDAIGDEPYDQVIGNYWESLNGAKGRFVVGDINQNYVDLQRGDSFYFEMIQTNDNARNRFIEFAAVGWGPSLSDADIIELPNATVSSDGAGNLYGGVFPMPEAGLFSCTVKMRLRAVKGGPEGGHGGIVNVELVDDRTKKILSTANSTVGWRQWGKSQNVMGCSAMLTHFCRGGEHFIIRGRYYTHNANWIDGPRGEVRFWGI